MSRQGENIYKRKDGRYEGRYVIGKLENGKTRFGYIYGYHYADVQHRLMEKKLARLQRARPLRSMSAPWANDCEHGWRMK